MIHYRLPGLDCQNLWHQNRCYSYGSSRDPNKLFYTKGEADLCKTPRWLYYMNWDGPTGDLLTLIPVGCRLVQESDNPGDPDRFVMMKST